MKTEQGTVFFITAIFKIFPVATASILEAFLQLFLLLVNITSSFLSVNQRFQSLYSNFCFLSFLLFSFVKHFFYVNMSLNSACFELKLNLEINRVFSRIFFIDFPETPLFMNLKYIFQSHLLILCPFRNTCPCSNACFKFLICMTYSVFSCKLTASFWTFSFLIVSG